MVCNSMTIFDPWESMLRTVCLAILVLNIFYSSLSATNRIYHFSLNIFVIIGNAWVILTHLKLNKILNTIQGFIDLPECNTSLDDKS